MRVFRWWVAVQLGSGKASPSSDQAAGRQVCASIFLKGEGLVHLVNCHRNSKQGLTYTDLVGKLADVGVFDSEPNIRNKISRGKFTAVFLLQCLEAIGTTKLEV